MRRAFSLGLVLFVWVAVACGSDDEERSKPNEAGTGGKQGTTCLDGYPSVGTQCAQPFEVCKSCGNPPWPCCDEFECQSGVWVKTQEHLACPTDAATDAEAGD